MTSAITWNSVTINDVVGILLSLRNLLQTNFGKLTKQRLPQVSSEALQDTIFEYASQMVTRLDPTRSEFQNQTEVKVFIFLLRLVGIFWRPGS